MSSLDAAHDAALQRIADMPPISVEGDRIVDGGEPGTSTPATPAGNETTTAATPADQPEDSFTRLDPNALPPELRPYYTSMQADYTRKMQEAAPFRQLAGELGLEAGDLRQAAELYTALQDPNQLVQFHSELSTALEQAGLSPAQAAAAATEHIQNVQAGEPDPQWSEDPEERRIQELESRLARFEQSQQAQAEQIRREQMQMALVSEMNRQEAVVREAHPDWTQGDIDTVYELSAFYGGSLLDAANRFESVVSDRIARILNGKGAVAGDPAHAPLPPALSGVTQPQSFGDDLEAAHEAALRAARLLP